MNASQIESNGLAEARAVGIDPRRRQRGHLLQYIDETDRPGQDLVAELVGDLQAIKPGISFQAAIGVNRIIARLAGQDGITEATFLRVDTEHGPLTMDTTRGVTNSPLRTDGEFVISPARAFLLAHLMREPDKVFSTAELYLLRYGVRLTTHNDSGLVKANIQLLRSDLGETDDKRIIYNFRGRGYSLVQTLNKDHQIPRADNLDVAKSEISDHTDHTDHPALINLDTPVGRVVFDAERGKLRSPFRPDEEIAVTYLEGVILKALMVHTGWIVSPDNTEIDVRTFKTYISSLRRKIGNSYFIAVRKGFGYYIDPSLRGSLRSNTAG